MESVLNRNKTRTSVAQFLGNVIANQENNSDNIHNSYLVYCAEKDVIVKSQNIPEMVLNQSGYTIEIENWKDLQLLLEKTLENIDIKYKKAKVVRKIQLIKRMTMLAMVLGFVAIPVIITVTHSINMYIIPCFFWILCCLSLYITEKVILFEWKD